MKEQTSDITAATTDSDNCDLTKHPLMRDGTSQQQRLLKALLPSYVAVDERSMEDLISFAKKYAEEIKFYSSNNTVDGNWVDFFTQAIDEKNEGTEPHYALFIAFLDLFRFAQDDLNTITQRHLDFYYRDVLQLKERPAVPDQVYAIFELAGQIASHLIAKNTLLNAGKDATAKDLVYAIDKDLVVNRAQVTELKALFANKSADYRLYASPVANSADGLGAKIKTEEPKWRTFGRLGTTIDRLQAETGFAFASPVLFLKEGNRAVSITLTFNNPVNIPADTLANVFRLQFSGEKGWIEPEENKSKNPPDTVQVSGNKITINRTLTQAQPAVVAYDAAVLLQPFNTTWPVVKVLLNTADNSNPFIYKILKSLTLQTAEVKVDVQGVKDLVLYSDLGKLAADKPFQPFSARPIVGSRFYIGSSEVFQKQLSALSIDIDWHGLPVGSGGFKSYYHNYIPAGENNLRTNTGFLATPSILDGKGWVDLKSQRLFDEQPVTVSTVDSFDKGPLVLTTVVLSNGLRAFRRINITDPALAKVKRDPLLGEVSALDANTFKGFFRLELSPVDFGHKNYSLSLTQQILIASHATKPETIPLPNEPYTPTIKEISLNYTSSALLSFAEITEEAFAAKVDQFFHVYPFGVAEVHPFLFLKPAPLFMLGQFNDEGTLYIGLSELVPAQNLSLLFKVSEGSANPDLEKQEVHWSYMVKDQWVEFPKLNVLSDATNGLLTSGIITFDVPSEASNNNTALTNGLHWLRATVADFSSAVCDLIDIRSQADTATFVNNDNDPEHLRAALPAETISKLVESDAAISTVTQPYASFGGKVKEQSTDFYIRVSERLRHKHRAVAIWDYERLVLEKFPAIYKIKCISHTEDNKDNYSELEPGHVTLIAVSNLRNKNAVNPLEPKTSLITLTEIRDYISTLTSCWVELDVRNPIFEEIKVTFNVRFLPGFDNGFYGKKLQEDIKRFLSPWAFDGSADLSFGGRIHRSMILNFVEEREYVDFVTCFSMDHIVGDTVFTDVEEAVATTAASVLVSYIEHEITVLETDECECDDNVVTERIKPPDDCNCDTAPKQLPKFGIAAEQVGTTLIVGHDRPAGINFFEIENDFQID